MTSGLTVPPSAAARARVVTLDLTSKNGGMDFVGLCEGAFSDRTLGRVRLYSDCSKRAVAFKWQGRTVAATPADPEAFLRAWRAGDTATYRTARRRLGASAALWLLALVGVLAALALMASWARRRLGYRFEHGALRLSTLFWTAHLSYQEIEDARLTGQHPGVRLFGTALPGYFMGRFTFDSGAPHGVQVVASSLSAPGVLVTHGDHAYYLTPERPAEFLAELERRRASLFPAVK